jgi:hypothetical protein
MNPANDGDNHAGTSRSVTESCRGNITKGDWLMTNS